MSSKVQPNINHLDRCQRTEVEVTSEEDVNALARRRTETEMEEIARGSVERHLGDVAADYESEEAAADAIYDEACTLAFDALVDAGVDHATARQVAAQVAQCYAQP